MSVGRSTARAAIWAFLSTAGAKAITLVGLAMLARLLAPSEFGLLAFALVYITYADTIGDLGSGVALIYWPDRRDDATQVTFLISIASGLFWCLSTIALAPAIAHFFNVLNHSAVFFALGFINKIFLVFSYTGYIGWNAHHIQFIDIPKFRCFCFSCTGHTGQFVIHPEIIL